MVEHSSEGNDGGAQLEGAGAGAGTGAGPRGGLQDARY